MWGQRVIPYLRFFELREQSAQHDVERLVEVAGLVVVRRQGGTEYLHGQCVYDTPWSVRVLSYQASPGAVLGLPNRSSIDGDESFMPCEGVDVYREVAPMSSSRMFRSSA